MMPFKPGQSGNPNGRPRKARALANIIETVGNSKSITTGITNKRALADTLWDVVITREYNGEKISLPQWLEIIQWLGHHIDGPVPTEIGVENSGEMIMRVVYENARDNGTPEAAS